MVVGNFPLAGKIAVVTGGGSGAFLIRVFTLPLCQHRDPGTVTSHTYLYRCAGISLAFVKLAAKHEGTRVIIADLRLNDEAAEFLKEARNVVFAKCDVAVWPDLHNLIKVSEKEFGDVPDVYIAGAGVFEPVGFPSPSNPLTT